MGYTFTDTGHPQVTDACIGCGECVETCPALVLQLEGGRPRVVDGGFVGCFACGHCMSVCPTNAIHVSGRGMQADDAFELPPVHHRATADQLETLLMRRRSIRRYREEEVSRHAVDRIVEMTATAPMGVPPSEVGVIVFHGREKVRQFTADAMDVFRRQAKMFNPWVLPLMRPLLGKAGYEAMRNFILPLFRFLTLHYDQGKDYFTYQAPAAMLFHTSGAGDPADCHIAATYAMLAAESLGLGSCLLGSPAAFNFAAAFKTKYGIPHGNKVGMAMTFGHPAVEFQRGVRRRLGNVRFA